jgi:hypothetical protein
MEAYNYVPIQSVRERLMRLAVLTSIIVFALATSANGQTSSQFATAKPAETYSYFKRVLGNLGAGRYETDIRKDDGFMTLTSCANASEYIGYDGDENSVVEKTANLAYDVLYLQAALRFAAYPRDIWGAILPNTRGVI